MEICATSSVSRLGKGLPHPRIGFSRRVDQMEAFPVALRASGERPLSLNGALFGFVATHERSERSLLGSERQQYITCDAGPPITGVHENHSTRYHRTWPVE